MTTSQHASIRHACLITSLALAFGYAPPRARRGVVAVAASHAFGEREFWRNVYRGETNFPAEEYSWYCGYAELAPFWNELVPRETDARDRDSSRERARRRRDASARDASAREKLDSIRFDSASTRR